MVQGKYSDVEVWGEARDRALVGVQKHMSAWGLTMPDVKLLMLNFGLDDFEKTGLTEFWVANEEEARYCGKFLFLFDGQTCPEHHHDVKHETFFVVKGKVMMRVDGKEREMVEGDLLAMDRGMKHTFTGVGHALLLEVSQPCVPDDNFFTDKQIGKDGVI